MTDPKPLTASEVRRIKNSTEDPVKCALIATIEVWADEVKRLRTENEVLVSMVDDLKNHLADMAKRFPNHQGDRS